MPLSGFKPLTTSLYAHALTTTLKSSDTYCICRCFKHYHLVLQHTTIDILDYAMTYVFIISVHDPVIACMLPCVVYVYSELQKQTKLKRQKKTKEKGNDSEGQKVKWYTLYMLSSIVLLFVRWVQNSDMDDSDFSDTEVDLEMGRRWKVTITRKENLVMQSWRGYYLKIWHLKSRKRRRSQVNVFCCSCCCCCRVQTSAIVCPCCMQNCYLIKKETAGSVGMSCIKNSNLMNFQHA